MATNPFAGYRVTSPFGWRKSPFGGGGREFHTGIDLVKAHKAPIYAFAAGTVLYAKFGAAGTGFGGYGNVVAVKDAAGRLHVYAHLDSCAVKVGTSVKAGQLVGYQGTTGKSTGSHLHYEVRKKSAPSFGWEADRANNCLEPTAYLRALGGGKTVAAAPAPAVAKRVYLPKTAATWRVYPTDKAPVAANAKGTLKPAKFGGLDYAIVGNPQKDVYTIKTGDYGVVNIYAAPSTGAVVK